MQLIKIQRKMSEQIDKHILIRYEPIKKIGSGAYGHVWKVMDRQKKTIHALKKNFDAFQNSTDAQRTYRQIMFLQQFSHPNIISLQKIIKSNNDKDIYLIFQFMDIDLYALIRQNILGERHKRYIVYQIAKALYYLHTADLVHRDIKPSNILVNQNCLAKICDFGLVRAVDDQTQANPVLTEYIATRWYRAPQILLGSKKYSKAIDIWSFGCLLGQLIKGKPFFPGNSTLNQIERVLTWTGPPSLSDIKALKTDFGKEMLDLLSKIKPINKKQWLSNCPEDGLDLLTRTLQFNPQKRYTMLDVLKHPYLQQFYNPQQILVSKQKIRTQIDDNKKLTLKDYRTLLYKQIKQKQCSMISGTQTPISGMITPSQQFPGHGKICKDEDGSNGSAAKTVYKNRFHKPVRSASKQRQDSAPNTNTGHKQGRSINIKKKYDSLFGHHNPNSNISNPTNPNPNNNHSSSKKNSFSRTKYVKTEQDIAATNPSGIQGSNARKKTEIVTNINKFFNEKKKKSLSVYQQKRQSQIIARYMYKNRYT